LGRLEISGSTCPVKTGPAIKTSGRVRTNRTPASLLKSAGLIFIGIKESSMEIYVELKVV
jgi:hypothetical protein